MTPQVLVVDDSEIIRTLIAGMLRETGYEVFQAATSEQALEIVASHDISIVLSDFSLGHGANGAEFLRRAKQLNPALKCILMSGSFAPGNTPRLPFPVISKPFDSKQIAALIAEMLAEEGG